jgi:hypothetical protein
MKALSIRQPWAYFILHVGKDIENRNWHTNFRGRCLIHAAKGMTDHDFSDAWEFAEGILHRRLPMLHDGDMPRGGIVGSVEIVDCVTEHASPWFAGVYGFVLRNPIALPFRPCRGALNFFDVPFMDASA